jgi:3-phosphoshikimate 1-carboxyvinyltransferase
MRLVVRPSRLGGQVRAPPSKSYTHRALVIAALARGESRIRNPLLAYDTEATTNCIRALGAEVRREGKIMVVSGTGGRLKPRGRVLDARNSGTTLRLLAGLASLSPKPVMLTGDESLRKRPMAPLLQALSDLGAFTDWRGREGYPPVVVGGRLRGGEVEITGRVSSQFISALLFAGTQAEEEVRISVTDELKSRPYVEITLELLRAAGAEIKHDAGLRRFRIPPGQALSPLDLEIPGDFSSASFLLGGGAITNSEVKVTNLDPAGVQGDKRIVDFLRDFGVEVEATRKAVAVKGGELSGADFDCADNPDLVPVLAVLGAVAVGRTEISNVPHLRVKESDRLRGLRLGLTRLGAEVEELPDGLRLRGVPELSGSEVWSLGDHRLAMAFAVAGLAARGQTQVTRAECIPVSYPSFVEDMRKLGARMEERE